MKTSLGVALLLLLRHASGQSLELLSLEHQEAPYSAMHWTRASAKAPVPLNGNTALLWGISAEQGQFQNSDSTRQMLYGLGTSLALAHKLTKDNRILVLFALQDRGLREYMDFCALGHVAALSILHHAHSGNVVGSGVGYSRQAAGHTVFPFVNMDWIFGENLRLHGALPLRPQLDYQWTHRVSTGVALHGESGSYQLERSGSGVQFRQWSCDAVITLQIWKHAVLRTAMGYTLLDQQRQFTGRSDSWMIFGFPLTRDKTTLESTDQRGWIFRASVSFVVGKPRTPISLPPTSDGIP